MSRKCSMLFSFNAVIWSRRSGCLVNGQHLLSLNTAALPPHPQQHSSVRTRVGCVCPTLAHEWYGSACRKKTPTSAYRECSGSSWGTGVPHSDKQAPAARSRVRRAEQSRAGSALGGPDNMPLGCSGYTSRYTPLARSCVWMESGLASELVSERNPSPP